MISLIVSDYVQGEYITHESFCTESDSSVAKVSLDRISAFLNSVSFSPFDPLNDPTKP